MKRFYRAAALGALALAVALPGSALAAKKHRKLHIRLTLVGAPISSTQNLYSVRDSINGPGAGIQTVTLNSGATAGTDTIVVYYRNGWASGRDSFTLGKPDANGVVSITGHGTSIGKAGKYKGSKTTYTFTGTDNTKTNRIQVTATGTLNT